MGFAVHAGEGFGEIAQLGLVEKVHGVAVDFVEHRFFEADAEHGQMQKRLGEHADVAFLLCGPLHRFPGVGHQAVGEDQRGPGDGKAAGGVIQFHFALYHQDNLELVAPVKRAHAAPHLIHAQDGNFRGRSRDGRRCGGALGLGHGSIQRAEEPALVV
ncbi:hypothetical protein [Hymenobacter negativus]|uniref:hypothetical protein n=1 Tax=Hymenobacter negativus TaxID=2795026 RepID=UPI00293D5D64|nr:hypothetical protein [Hymenobacter negativus]